MFDNRLLQVLLGTSCVLLLIAIAVTIADITRYHTESTVAAATARSRPAPERPATPEPAPSSEPAASPEPGSPS